LTSVSDLIAARECDAEDILFNLGFAATSEDENRKNVSDFFHTHKHEFLHIPE